MRAAARSDVGLVRENNEDYLIADEEHGIFLLADGMGGGPAGELASRLAVEAAHESLLRQLGGEELPVTGRLLAEALAAAHSAVAKRALADASLQGMGTTLEIVVVRGAEAFSCHLGDSRVYLFRGAQLQRLTDDDNYAGVLAQEGVPADRIPSAYRHMLTQAVGATEELIPELRRVTLKPGDLMLICSDGLNASVTEGEIAAVMGRPGSEPEEIAEELVQAANERGGADNVSVLIVEPVAKVAAGTLPMAPAPR